jgi:D-alanyl-D-alanine carboxypeptidase
MSLNFIPQENNRFGNIWRNGVVVLLFIFIAGLVATKYVSLAGTVFETAPVTTTSLVAVTSVSVQDTPRNTIGGDINFEHTVPAPQLSSSSVMISPDEFTAESIVVKDKLSGKILYAKNEYDEHPIASITKLMSALVLLETSPNWPTSTQVVDDIVEDTHMYAGDTYTLEELWNATLVGSSNKAVLTLVDATGWKREAFVERMNQKAEEIGMSNTHFFDPTGLDERNTATASDVAILLSEALRHNRICDALLTKECSLYSNERDKKQHIWNTDWLLLGWTPNQFMQINGGKTGYIPSSGYNFTVEVVDDVGHAIDIVILGATLPQARFEEAKKIGEWVFENYIWASR